MSSLRIHVLNVGHGDSIVLEHRSPDGVAFGLVDSNCTDRDVDPPALVKLRALGAQELSFVLLTHPHADHWRGLLRVIQALPVRSFYSYPLFKDRRRLKTLGAKYVDAAKKSASARIVSDVEELVLLMIEAHRRLAAGTLEWTELEGPTEQVRPHGFANVVINALLPLKKYKGEHYALLDKDAPESLESPYQNKLSVALEIRFGEFRVGLGADGIGSAWLEHRRYLERSNEKLMCDVVKMPHHGGRDDCTEPVIDYVFSAVRPQIGRIALISAPGTKNHPAEEVLGRLKARKIAPYCTNLSVFCGNNLHQLLTSAQAAPEVARLLNMLGATPANAKRPACQGDICIDFTDGAAPSIHRQYNHPCAFRGDFDLLTA